MALIDMCYLTIGMGLIGLPTWGGDHTKKMTGAHLFGGPTRARKTKARIARAQVLMAAAREPAAEITQRQSAPRPWRVTEAHSRRLAQMRSL